MCNPADRSTNQVDSEGGARRKIQDEGDGRKSEIVVGVPADRLGHLASDLKYSVASARGFGSAERIENMNCARITVGIERMSKSRKALAAIPGNALPALQPAGKRRHDVLRVAELPQHRLYMA